MVSFLRIRSFPTFQYQPSSLQACAIALLLTVAAFSLNFRVADGASDTSRCGPGFNGGKPCDQGNCCSGNNYCGSSAEHCSANCLSAYSSPDSLCTASSPGSGPSNDLEKCGRDATPPNKKCADNACCSEWGYCGSDSSYCYKSKGCQSQCRYSPGEIGGIVGGVLGGLAFICVIAFCIFKWYRKHQNDKPVIKEDVYPVHRLYPSDESRDEETCLDVVFCHGFQFGELERDAWKNTWRARNDPGVCWPRDWLADDLQGKARIFALEYDANMTSDPSKKGWNTDVSDIASNLLRCIFGDRYRIGQSNAVVLIGHSFGGLVIKNLVVEAQRLAQLMVPNNDFDRAQAQSCRTFLSKIEAFVFYAVPHSGAKNLEAYIKKCDNIMLTNRFRLSGHEDHDSSLLSNIRAFSRDMENLSHKFESFVRANDSRDYDLIIYAFTEGLPMTRGDRDLIVEHGSAVRGSGLNHYKIETANHMTVCRHSSKEDPSYQQLLGVLQIVFKLHVRREPHPSTCEGEFVDRSSGDIEDQLANRSLLLEGSLAKLSTSQKLSRRGSKLRDGNIRYNDNCQ